MEAKEILAQVKEFFNNLVAPAVPAVPAAPVAPAGFTQYELAAGGSVTIDKLEIGGVVTIDGNPALPGDLELKDGTKLKIGDNGVIAEMETGAAPPAPAAAPPAMPNGMSEETFKAFETSTNQKFSEYELKFASYENKFSEYEQKLEKSTKVIEQLLKLSEVLVDKPAAEPAPVVTGAGKFKAEPESVKVNLDALFS